MLYNASKGRRNLLLISDMVLESQQVCMLCRYGLESLAEDNLMDLIATARHYAATGLSPALWFSAFCALIPEQLPQLIVAAAVAVGAAVPQPPGGITQDSMSPGATTGTSTAVVAAAGAAAATLIALAAAEAVANTAAGRSWANSPTHATADAAGAMGSLSGELLSQLLLQQLPYCDQGAAVRFYLFCCCQLAYPSTITALFPEADDAAPLVKGHLLLDSLKAIAR
jgi:hypothetical protein